MAKRFLSNIRINDAYTFPASDGTNNQVIKTDGSGNLSFGQLATDSASVMYKDTFTGDGSTTGFTLANALNDEVQSNIYIDGVYQSKSTYSVSGTTVTFSTAPLSGHEIEVISTTGINSGPTAIYTDTFTANGSATAFTLGQTVHSENQTIVFLNGVYQFKGTYALSGTTLTLDTAPSNGVSIEVMSIGSAYSGGDILYDHDFTSAGLMTSDGSGVYSITANNSANWNTAYGWGDHGLSAQDKTDIGNLSGTNTGDQDLSSYATQSYVGTQISNLVGSSPATLDTLNELAAALGDDPNFAATTATNIGLKAPLASPTFTGTVTAPNFVLTGTDGFNLPSGGFLDWANGDARIVEGLVNNYSLSFQTWDGSAISTALRLDGNNNATFTGSVTLSTNGTNFTHGYSGNGLVLSHHNVGPSNAIVSGNSVYPDNLFINSGGAANDWSNVTIYGNVGIGTTSPDAKLEVASGQAKTVTSGVQFARFGTSNEASNYATLTCEVKGAAAAANRKWIFQTIENGVANAGNIVFQPSGGNIGIGTDSPAEALQIGQGKSMMIGNSFFLGSGDSDYLGSMGFNRDTTNGNIFNSSYGAYQIHNYQGTLKLQVYSAAGGTIGEHKFYNDASIRFKSSVEFSDGVVRLINNQLQSGFNSNSEDNDFWINYTGYQGGTTRYRDFRIGNGKQGQIAFFDGSTGYSIFNGNVGIGVTSPVKKLQVSDSATGLMTNLLLTNTHDTNGDTTGIAFSMTDNDLYNKAGIVFERTGNNGVGSLHLCNNNTVNSSNFTLADTALTIISGGNIGIGETTPATKLHVKHPAAINDAYGLVLVENTSTGSGGPVNSAVNVKNYYGTSQFMQWENNGVRIGSRILANGGTGDIIFTAGSDQEKMRLRAGGGITFNGDTASANALDDYEEGTFTPDLGAGTYVYQHREGHYVKIGNMVHIHIGFRLSSASPTSSNASIGGLPFAGKFWGSYQEPHERVGAAGELITANLSSHLSFYVTSGGSTLYARTTANNADNAVAANLIWKTNSFIKLQLIYTVS